jgi:hypothetical protein
MKNIVFLFAIVVSVAACDDSRDERPLTAACAPAVSVTVPTAPKARANAGTGAARNVVQVYWDVSSSMRDFAATRRARRGKSEQSDGGAWSDDLTPVVAALDSSVLLRAHADTVEQYGVGESIQPLPSARSALHPRANGTALHLAAEQIGTALATGSAQAALVVSDMELDTPPRTSAADATVCGGVPLPSTPEAGSLFGRCFEHAVLAVDAPPRIRTHLVVHAFRKSTHGRELFILLLATDREFGRRISDELVQRLDFARQVVFDADSVAAANVRECRLTALAPGVRVRPPRCSAKCFDADSIIQAECDVHRPIAGAWIEPSGRGADGVTYQSSKKKAGDAVVQFAIPCNAPPGRFNAAVDFHWRVAAASVQDGDTSFAQKASVRDLFDSLNDAIVRIVAPRRLQIGIDLAK